MEVKAWLETVSIPTYKAGEPEKNPMFLEKRVYQGSSGVVYPHPVIEKIADEKADREYTAVFLENAYLKIMLLPELGGRVQRAFDKVRNRDFVYYNQVIKPALVGLAGPWISGGIEFNWPQHHRPSTFEPVDFTLQDNPDGSKTVWMNEIEVMFRTRGMAGFTLYPDKAYLEIKGRLFNRTPFPQTFLWWANPAVKVNDAYQSVFPPDVYAVFDHGKRDVSDFPIATGTYYKVNYAPGTDISRYTNIPVPTSYMAIRSRYDFMGCYEHDTRAGMLHVANHHFSPGKKQWTWGNGDFGQAWDRNLTDEDGPYIELMTGVFTDNQPDFSWLQPNEEKTFEQYFMPYAEIGLVKNATKEAMLNLEWEGRVAHIKAYATAAYPRASIRVFKEGSLVHEYTFDLAPDAIFEAALETGAAPGGAATKSPAASKEPPAPGAGFVPNVWKVTVSDQTGRELVSYQPEAGDAGEIPAAATAARPPAEIGQVEDLYLNGLHLEQYRHATYDPMDYYGEGIKRSPDDVRCNNAIGLLLLRRGQFQKAEPYLNRAIATLTRRNPNPYDGEPYYNLGWCLQLQGKYDEAYDAFYKATWNDAWQHSGFLALARLASRKRDSRGALPRAEEALALVQKSLIRNYHSPAARHVKAILLRKLGRGQEAEALIAESLEIDSFNFGCLFERYLASGQDIAFKTLMRGSLNNYLELSLDYAQSGCYEEATQVLTLFTEAAEAIEARVNPGPLPYYYMGWYAAQAGDPGKASELYQKGAAQSPGTCFPNKLDEVLIFQSAHSLNPTDARALYYLGNLWYDKRQYGEAITCWEGSARLDDTWPTVFRNLSLAYYNKRKEREKSIACMEKAFMLAPDDARVLMELDQLYKVTGRPFAERLKFLEQCPDLVDGRDDLYLEQATLCNQLGQFGRARDMLASRKFHPWEGGEGKVVGQYLLCHTELARQAIDAGEWDRAFSLLEACAVYPENLGEGKLYGTQENDRHYLLGCIYEAWNKQTQAVQKFREATVGISEPAQAIFYNDPQPDKIIYQALAWLKLGEPGRAREIFERFIQFGRAHMEDKIQIDYFAVSLPDMLVFDQDLSLRNRVHCTYLMGLGYYGLGDYPKAQESLGEVLRLDKNHQGAATYLRMTQRTVC